MISYDVKIPQSVSKFWRDGILKTVNARAIARAISAQCFGTGGIGQENFNNIQNIQLSAAYKKAKVRSGKSNQVGVASERRIIDALTNPKSKYRKIIAKNGKKHGLFIGLGFKNMPVFKSKTDLGMIFQKGRIAGFQYETGKTAKVGDLTARRKNAKTKVSRLILGQPARPVWLAKPSDSSKVSAVFNAELKKQLQKISAVSK